MKFYESSFLFPESAKNNKTKGGVKQMCKITYGCSGKVSGSLNGSYFKPSNNFFLIIPKADIEKIIQISPADISNLKNLIYLLQ